MPKEINLIVNKCSECIYFWDESKNPYPDVGWNWDRCTKANKILGGPGYKDMIPDWCPLPDSLCRA